MIERFWRLVRSAVWTWLTEQRKRWESLVIRAAEAVVREGFLCDVYGFADCFGLFADVLGKMLGLVGVVLEL